ncbi:MAG: SURF1 family cytochrome oxidase biogenesis protein, partial [Actinomycetia bacterium]|nr:SURF1 family cytochrome oxidase biogenesis protein [Actinomycetes bacterium]
MDVLKRLLQPKWIGGLLLATLFAVACYFLGQWQWSRYEAKADRNATLDRNYAAEPVALGEVTDADGIRPGADWSRVELQGTYEPQQIYVRNRPNDGVYGYEVLGVLHTDTDGPVIVDRGWVRFSPEGAAVLPPVQDPPGGEVSVVGWIRPYESSLGREMPENQVASIALEDLTDETGVSPASVFVRAQEEMASGETVDSGLVPLEAPDRSLGPHQAYAIQWWITMILGYAFVVLGVRRELREEEDARDPEAAAERARLKAEKKRQKVSRWDEED